LTVDQFPDPLDDAVSFFGGPTSFNGLSVVIDNQPSTPLTRRSDRQHWGPEESGIGAEEWSVVSGVIDDGRGHIKWLEDRKRSDLEEDEEAAYLVCSPIFLLASFTKLIEYEKRKTESMN
jgi:hypothetical protein